MPLTDQQHAFLTKHLKVKLAQDEGQTGATPGKLTDIWRTAKEQTDAGVTGLQTALKSHRSSALDRIADAGLNGITEGNSVAMMRALMDYDSAAADSRAKASATVLKQVDAYRTFLSGSTVLDLVENNPFGVPVAIKAPLTAALDNIAGAVSG